MNLSSVNSAGWSLTFHSLLANSSDPRHVADKLANERIFINKADSNFYLAVVALEPQ